MFLLYEWEMKKPCFQNEAFLNLKWINCEQMKDFSRFRSDVFQENDGGNRWQKAPWHMSGGHFFACKAIACAKYGWKAYQTGGFGKKCAANGESASAFSLIFFCKRCLLCKSHNIFYVTVQNCTQRIDGMRTDVRIFSQPGELASTDVVGVD